MNQVQWLNIFYQFLCSLLFEHAFERKGFFIQNCELCHTMSCKKYTISVPYCYNIKYCLKDCCLWPTSLLSTVKVVVLITHTNWHINIHRSYMKNLCGFSSPPQVACLIMLVPLTWIDFAPICQKGCFKYWCDQGRTQV